MPGSSLLINVLQCWSVGSISGKGQRWRTDRDGKTSWQQDLSSPLLFFLLLLSSLLFSPCTYLKVLCLRVFPFSFTQHCIILKCPFENNLRDKHSSLIGFKHFTQIKKTRIKKRNKSYLMSTLCLESCSDCAAQHIVWCQPLSLGCYPPLLCNDIHELGPPYGCVSVVCVSCYRSSQHLLGAI